MNVLWLALPVAVLAAFAVGYLLQGRLTSRRLGDAASRARRVEEDAARAAEARLADAAARARQVGEDAERAAALRLADASGQARGLQDEAERRRRGAELEAKELLLKARADAEDEARRREREAAQVESRARAREELVARQAETAERRAAETAERDRVLGQREEALAARARAAAEQEAKLAAALDEERRKLETIAGLTAEEAKRQLLGQVEAETRREAQVLVMRLEEEARETAQVKAREVLATSIQRLAPDYTVETTVSVVDLPSDDMKGRIIGREGRNIRALEQHTGVDLIIDDTPETVLVSAYDPYRREIAKRALQVLVADGRIHPARIEEVVEKTKREMEEHLGEEGERACFEVGVAGLHPELVKLVGRLRYRTSYGQNCLQHSKEVAWLAGMMAAEIGASVPLAKRMGLLHDIGKALTHEQDGSHPEISLDVLTKYRESPAVINAALCGHESVKAETIEAVLTEAADGISAARPGARRDVLESYLRRLAQLEEIALSYQGVDLCYAIQAGRELRVMTKADVVSDFDAAQLARDISKRIENEMQYPGHIKVVVIRETRAVEVAR